MEQEDARVAILHCAKGREAGEEDEGPEEALGAREAEKGREEEASLNPFFTITGCRRPVLLLMLIT